MNHLVLVLDLPWELKEMINQYLENILVIRKLEKKLKFPKMKDFQTVKWLNQPCSVIRYDYKFICGIHAWDLSIRADYRYAIVVKHYFI